MNRYMLQAILYPVTVIKIKEILTSRSSFDFISGFISLQIIFKKSRKLLVRQLCSTLY